MKQFAMAIALGLAAGTVSAGQAGMTFGQADSNNDGAITRAEAASFAALEQRFDSVDTNSNGLIEQQEFSQAELADAPAQQAAE